MDMNLHGHAWTLLEPLRHILPEPPARPSTPWQTRVPDPLRKSVTLTGHLCESPGGSDSLLIILHGLGGNPDRPYCLRASEAAARAGVSSLRIALRGADHRGEDFCHAGLIDDLIATLESPTVQSYRRVFLLGYSMGGHVALRYAALEASPRLVALATVCAPLDLQVAGRVMDSPGRSFYRWDILRALKRIYRDVALRQEVPTPPESIDPLWTFREFDLHTIVPRFGFLDVDHYYRTMSVGPLLPAIRVPTLILSARRDPMIPAWSLQPWLERITSPVEIRWLENGGHLGFPRRIDLGLRGRRDLESQVLTWLLEH